MKSPDEWLNKMDFYVNFPILNDRLAIVRGTGTLSHATLDVVDGLIVVDICHKNI